MRTAGKLLIFCATGLRAVVVISDDPEFRVVIALLAVYGLLLITETWMTHRRHPWFVKSRKAQLLYLFLQSLLVLGLLIASNYEDFLAELFIPLSLDAVSLLGRILGFRVIMVFSLAMTGLLLFSPQGPVFGLAMGFLYSGLSFIFGGYAGQIQNTEAARLQNQRTYNELQEAHYRLQGYADRLVALAVERERSHLARELHDSVTQTVFSMNLAAQSARLLWDRQPVQVAGQLSRLEELAASAQREIQALVSQLSPAPILEMGLPAALRKLAEEQKSRNGLHVSLEVDGEGNFSDPVAAGLYTIAQEALTNAARHSGCREAVLCLHLATGGSSLEVEDHGRGFNPRGMTGQRGHLGLTGMSERAREIGWTLSVLSQPGQGTRILVSERPPGGRE